MKYVNLSVIVPVYNTKDFLDECIASLLNQKITNMEILLINDGSTDGSDKILKSIASKDKRFRYIECINGGLSVARNTGLKLANGKYVAFLDSDDWISDEYSLDKLFSLAEITNADIVVGNTLSIHSKGSKVPWDVNYSNLFSEGEKFCGKDFFDKMINNNCYIPMVYNYIYKNSFLKKNNFLFQPNLIHEDELWTPQVLTLAPLILCSDVQHYCYRQREGSIMNTTILHKRLNSIRIIIQNHIRFAKKSDKYSTVGNGFYINILRLCWIMYQLCETNEDFCILFDDFGKITNTCQSELICNKVSYYNNLLTLLKNKFNTIQTRLY